MKKLILLTPLLVVPTLIGCNKSPTYLELWSKETRYLGNRKLSESTAKIEGKHQVEINTVQYNKDGETPVSTEKIITTYNEHDDIKTHRSEFRSSGGSLILILNDNYTYEYRKDGLISKTTIEHSDDETTVTIEHTYQYDDLKRLTEEKQLFGGELVFESYSTYSTKFNIYSTNRSRRIKHGDSYWVNTTNTINDAGDVIKQIIEPEEIINSLRTEPSRSDYTYDEYRCPIHTVTYEKNLDDEWEEIGTTDKKFHKNNPNKLLESTYRASGGSYITNCAYTYDEYDRKTSYIGPGAEANFGRSDEKIIWEYDQVVIA